MINSRAESENASLNIAEPPLFLAPMAGLTDAPFRCLCRILGGMAGAFVPMIGARAILNKGSRPKSLQLIDWLPGEKRAVQLFGGDIAEIRAACALMLDMGAEEVNINLGCQMPKIVKNGGGAVWLRDADRALTLLSVCAETLDNRAELSLKLRLGWDRFSILPLIERLGEVGVRRAFVHGRLGLQAFDGEADIRALGEVVRRSAVPIYANGDINGFEAAKEMFKATGCAGLMIGRGALGNPGIFAQLRERFRAESGVKSVEGGGTGAEAGMAGAEGGGLGSGRQDGAAGTGAEDGGTGAEAKAAGAEAGERERLRFAALHIDLAEKYMRREDSELAAVRRLRRHLTYYKPLAPYAAEAQTFEQLRRAAQRAAEENCSV